MAYQRVLEALADPTRRGVLEILRSGPAPVGRIAAQMPVSRPAVSQHLRVLRDVGLVRQRRVGTRNIYSVDVEGLRELRRYLDRFWGDVLEAYAREVSEQPTSTENGGTPDE